MLEHHDHSAVHSHELGTDACCGPAADVRLASGFHADRSYKVRGLCCAEEVAVLRRAVGPVVGGAGRLTFDVLNGRMTIADDAGDVAEEAIVKAVARTGMTAVRWTGSAGKDETDLHRRQQVLFTAASGALVLIGIGLHVMFAGGFADAWKIFGA